MFSLDEFDTILHKHGKLHLFWLFKWTNKGIIFMDPITAIFNFLSSAQGQEVVKLIIQVDTAFITLIAGLVKKVHDKN